MAHLIKKYSFPPEKDMLRPPALVDPLSTSWYNNTMRRKSGGYGPEVTLNTFSRDKVLTGTDVLSAKLREALSASRHRDSSTTNHYTQYQPRNYNDLNGVVKSSSGQIVTVNNYVNSSNSASGTRTSPSSAKLDLYGATDHKRSIAVHNDASAFPSRSGDYKSSAQHMFPISNYVSTYNSTYGAASSHGSKGSASITSVLKDYNKHEPSLSTASAATKDYGKSVDFVANNSRPKSTSIPSRLGSASVYDKMDYSSTNIVKVPSNASDEFYMRKLGEILNVHNGPLFTSNPSMVTDYMYVGGYKDAENWHQLRRLGITHVLNMAALRKSSYNPYPPQSGIVGYEAFDADDHEGYNVMQHFPKAKAFIDRARWSNGKVLVHCAMGVNRSGTMCCAYLMAEHKVPLIDAARKMKKARGTTLCNRGFQKQLLRYARQKQLLG